MEPALSPKEIQSRIRAGESVAAVAAAAGMPEDKIEVFASPVIAEREHIAGLARTSLVRRRGDAASHRNLFTVVTERLRARRLDADEIVWDAYRLPDRTWRVVGVLQHGDLVREAWFTYDARGRFSVTANADARWLIGEEAPRGTVPPGDENTVDLNDELALVRATAESPATPPEPDAEPEPPVSILSKIRRAGQEELEDLAEDYHPAELAEVDGMYDIVGPKQNQMDVLYEMLSGISEDSVRIYADLTQPVGDPPEEGAVSSTEPEPAPAPSGTAEPDPEPQQPADDAPEEAGQGALIKSPPGEQRSKRRRRASVPAWDDILFGGPSPKK
ncbi:MAG: septation protein SepH [Propionibacteriaceae bacterium]|nr:septation protein SepH [Propionibacteriaceae bacterium]